MRLSRTALLVALPALVSSFDLPNNHKLEPTTVPSASSAPLLDNLIVVAEATTTASTSTPTPPHPPIHYHIPPHLQDFIQSMNMQQTFQSNDSIADDGEGLVKRQQGGVGGGVGPPIEQPTQMPTVQTYVAYPGGIPTTIVYTQLFSAVPSQFPTPTVGSVGLGTITGAIGVVRTGSISGAEGRATIGTGKSLLVLGLLGAMGFVV